MDSVEAALSPVPSTPFSTALVSGGLAGTAVDTLFFPIDTLKTRAQSEQGFFRAGGFSGVYRGLGSAVVGSAPGASLFFTSYELSKDALPKFFPRLGTTDLAPVLHMISASLGEIAACMVRVPTEVVKQRSQTGSKGTRSWVVAKTVWQGEGLRGFYRGFGSTVAREIPFTCLQFPLYERLKLLLARRTLGHSASVSDLPAWQAAACGSIAGGVAAGLTTPLDVAKTRIMLANQTSSDPAAPAQRALALLPTLHRIYAREGASALFAGVVPRVVWISMGGAVFLGVYEKAKAVLRSDAERTRGRERD
ncbi:S-adenosylmethionine transporter [Rhodotorula toruloides ATCC 204091]|uniref:S-adenosylmethionine transporter n=1 Tax=Rhodotorula toruloides TaxID=5286 RepID=A0A0K3C895_RHOTO|nr:S-adenosylmethionine transporter [Rhodotorula toruloides ATCC 204091]PRQ76614.1 S-adenosylmethionine transporter [Rhodotorula toruloides]